MGRDGLGIGTVGSQRDWMRDGRRMVRDRGMVVIGG